TLGGLTRNRLATVNLTTGAPLSWDPNANGPVFSLLPQPGVVYAGGVFITMGAASRSRVAGIDPQTGAATAWDPISSGTVRAIVAAAGNAYSPGHFPPMPGPPRDTPAGVPPDAGTPCPAIALTAPPLPKGVAGTPYVTSITATGGVGPYCYSVGAGALPAGLALHGTTGQVSGRPSAARISVFSLSAPHVRGCIGTAGYTLTIPPAPAPARRA